MFDVDLDFKTGKGIVNPNALDDLRTSKEYIIEIKGNSVRKFNKEAKDMLINRLYILLILIGVIGIIVAAFFIQYPYKYMAIAFGIFLIPLYPLYVCMKNKKKDSAIKKFISSVQKQTGGELGAMTNSRFKVIKNLLGEKRYKEFKGFTVYVADHIQEEIEFNEQRKRDIQRHQARRRRERQNEERRRASSMIPLPPKIKEKKKKPDYTTRAKSELPDPKKSGNQGMSKIQSFIRAKPAQKPQSTRSFEEEPKSFRIKERGKRDSKILEMPVSKKVETDSVENDSSNNVLETEVNSKNNSALQLKKKMNGLKVLNSGENGVIGGSGRLVDGGGRQSSQEIVYKLND